MNYLFLLPTLRLSLWASCMSMDPSNSRASASSRCCHAYVYGWGNWIQTCHPAAMRYHYLYILLLATLCVVLKQAYAGAADMQDLMKQRQDLHELENPTFKKLMKLKRKNGFLSKKKKQKKIAQGQSAEGQSAERTQTIRSMSRGLRTK